MDGNKFVLMSTPTWMHNRENSLGWNHLSQKPRIHFRRIDITSYIITKTKNANIFKVKSLRLCCNNTNFDTTQYTEKYFPIL